MRPIGSIPLSLILALNVSPVLAADSILLLLGAELKELRSLPPDAPTHAKCPNELKPLYGTNKDDIENALGRPDLVDRESGAWWAYIFASPRTVNSGFGGGHPELSLYFGADMRVIRATCYYSK
jgi:hypothetical protein